MAEIDLPSFRRRLARWFERNRRDLPWRADRDPYRIWVSEVMLQQTTVAAVAPAFRRFLSAFPTLADLAAADEAEVLRLWEGLGYYGRARNLHAAAKALSASHGGELPDDPKVWSALPGVGRYILGAVLSQAFDRRLPVVEANTQRVLCRLFAVAGDPRSTEVKNRLWAKAAEILPRKRAGDFNQAMMELGALVCTPVRPKCGECPVAKHCEANRLGLQSELPTPSAKPAAVSVSEVAVVARRGGDVLLAQRPPRGRWANMWEFPHAELDDGETHEASASRLLAGMGFDAELGPELMTVRHSVTHHRITMVALEATFRGGEFRAGAYVQARWVPPARLTDYPVSSPQRKLADAVGADSRQARLF